MKDEIINMIDAWKKGNADAIDFMLITKLIKHPELKPWFEKINDDRNVKMLEKIEGFLKTSDVHFVVVGSAHLVGEKGLIKLLENKNYKVEQVLKNSKPVEDK